MWCILAAAAPECGNGKMVCSCHLLTNLLFMFFVHSRQMVTGYSVSIWWLIMRPLTCFKNLDHSQCLLVNIS